MIKKHINKLKNANGCMSDNDIYKSYKEQRKTYIDFAIDSKKIEDILYKTIEEDIKKFLLEI